jgi:hypothetical protein
VPPNYANVDTAFALIATVVVFISLFDIGDIAFQVGSFHFLRTPEFFVYLLLRLFLGVTAAALLASQQPNQPPWLLGVVAGLASVTLLQNFAVKIAGQDIINLAQFMQTSRDKLVSQEASWLAERLQARVVSISEELADRSSKDDLRGAFQRLRYQTLLAAGVDDPAGRVITALKVIEQQANDDDSFQVLILAAEITQQNLDYARRILARPPHHP